MARRPVHDDRRLLSHEVDAVDAAGLGARADEWKLTLSPPPLVRRLGEAAGLTSTQANVRSLWV